MNKTTLLTGVIATALVFALVRFVKPTTSKGEKNE